MGALVTLELPADSPVLALPWIITFGPIEDDETWEPVVCGPYEREHALALAESVVADEELMAVVEPVLPHTSVDEIRDEIAAAKAAAEDEEDEEDDVEGDDEVEVDVDEEFDAETDIDAEYEDDDEGEYEEVEAAPPPSPEEVRAGFARIAAKLTSA